MLVVLSSALDDAMREGLVARNVARLVKRPAVEHHEMATWTAEQAVRFREHVRGDQLAACWLLTLAGLRRSEVLGLRWSDVDLDGGTVTIAQGRVVAEGQGTITGDPKSKRSRRALPMPAEVLAALRVFRLRQSEERLAIGSEYPDTGLVAVDVIGLPIRPETYSGEFMRHAKGAGVPLFRLHDVRHTAATMLLDRGTTPSATANGSAMTQRLRFGYTGTYMTAHLRRRATHCFGATNSRARAPSDQPQGAVSTPRATAIAALAQSRRTRSCDQIT
jgi:integrase